MGTELLRQIPDTHFDKIVAVTSKRELPAQESFGDRLVIVAPDDIEKNKEIFASADILLNCAFPRNVDGTSLAQGLAFIDAMFAAAASAGVGAVVNVSSQSVYSQHRSEPATEKTPLCLESKYAVAKYAVELLLEARCQGIPHTNIRMASLIGPGFDQRVVNKMVKKALAGERLSVQENGSRFGFLDVRDAAAGLLAVCKSNPATWKAVYNLGPDDFVSLTEIADCVYAAVCVGCIDQKTPLVAESDVAPVFSELYCDSFKSDFPWRQVHGLSDSVKSILNTMQAND